MEFLDWKRGLPIYELAQLLPKFARKPGSIQDSALKTHFENNIWSERAQVVFGLAKLDSIKIRKQIDHAFSEATE